MLRSHFLLLVLVLCTINQIECSKIEDILPSYYNSETVKRFEEEWQKYKSAFENAIGTGLQQEFGRSSVNIFEENRPISHVLAKGFSLSDGVVNVYFFDMVLRELPLLVRPDVKISLSNNYLSVYSRVDRMFIDTTYYVARNKSSEVYAHPTDQKNTSPFSLQQVDRFGKVTITAEDCLLSDMWLGTLSGDSVNLGHSRAKVDHCKFTVEISTPHSGAPPVIAPYFPDGPSEKLELLLTAPIAEELQDKLQGALYSYVNTSVLFGSQEREFREKQQDLFKSYAEYIRKFVFKVNQNTLKSNKGVVKMPNYDINIDSAWVGHASASCSVGLRDLKLYGLETAYVGRSGGPYNNHDHKAAADAIIFSSLQIRGKVTHDDGNGSTTNDFTAELIDTTVNILISIEASRTKIIAMDVTGWRSLAFGIIPWRTHYNERISYQSLVYGYLLNELPAQVKKHLSSILGAALTDIYHDGGSGGHGSGGSGGGAGGGSGGDSGGGSGGGGGYGKTDLDSENDAESTGGKKEFFTDDNLAKDFFTDDNIKKDFFTDDSIKEDFFTDDNIKKDFFTDDNIKKDFFTDDNIKKDFFTDDNMNPGLTDNNGGVTGETDNNGGVTYEDRVTDGNGGLTGDVDNSGGMTDEDVTDGNGGLTGETDNNGGMTDEDKFTDGNGGLTGEADNSGGMTDEDKLTDGNGGLTGEADNSGGMTDEDKFTDGNGGLTGEADNNGGMTDEDKFTDGNGGLTGEADNNGGMTDDDKFTDGNGGLTGGADNNGGLTDEDKSTDENGGVTGETDNNEGLSDEDRLSDENGGVAGETDKNEGLSDEGRLSDENGGVTDDRLSDENGSVTGETDNNGRVTNEDIFTDNGKPFLDENFFSDFESRRVVAKDNNGTVNNRLSKKRDDNKKGVKRRRVSSIKKEAARVNYRAGEATGEANINKNVKDNSRMAKKPALPPNVHNMRRFNNPRMSENEIR